MPVSHALDLSAVPRLITNAALGANGTYTSPIASRITGNYLTDRLRVSAWADQAGSIAIQESNDGAAWTTTNTTAVTASTFADTGFVLLTKLYWKIVYTNGATAQGTFSLFAATSAGYNATASSTVTPQGADGKRFGTSTSNPDSSVLLSQLTGSSASQVAVTATQGSVSVYTVNGGSLAASSSVTLIDTGTGKVCSIQAIALASGYNQMNLQLYFYNAAGAAVQYGNVYADATSEYDAGINVNTMAGATLPDAIFEVLGTSATVFKLSLKSGVPLYAPNGYKIVVQNADTAAHYWRAQALHTQQA